MRWSSPTATRSCETQTRRTWHSSWLEIPLGKENNTPATSADHEPTLTRHPSRATTHTDLVLRARELSIPVRTVPNASIMSAIGATGLQLYNFGQTVSMVFFTDNWRPTSFYDRVRENRQHGLHTLVLLDIKVKEQSLENMARGRKIYEPPRYMTAGLCARQMLEVEEVRGEGAYGPNSLAIAAARVGSRTEKFVAGTLKQICDADELLGGPLHSLVLLGRRTHELEHEFAREFAVDKDTWDRLWNEEYKGRQ